MFLFHKCDCYCYFYCNCNARRSVLTALSRTGRRLYGRHLLWLPLLRMDSFSLAVVFTGDVTAGYPPPVLTIVALSPVTLFLTEA
jgi:hypothetical protein